MKFQKKILKEKKHNFFLPKLTHSILHISTQPFLVSLCQKSDFQPKKTENMMQKMIVNHAGSQQIYAFASLSLLFLHSAFRVQTGLHEQFMYLYSKDWLLRIPFLNVFLKKREKKKPIPTLSKMCFCWVSFFFRVVGVCKFQVLLHVFILSKRKRKKRCLRKLCSYVSLSFMRSKKAKEVDREGTKIIMKLKMIK